MLAVHCMPDHMHLFVGFRPVMSISDFVKEEEISSIYYETERMFFVDDSGNRIAVPLLRIHDRLKWRKPIHFDEFKFMQALTNRTIKITIPSPTVSARPTQQSNRRP